MYRTFYSLRDCAVELGVSVKTVRRRIADGTIRAVWFGGVQRIPHSELTKLELGWAGPGRNGIRRKKGLE